MLARRKHLIAAVATGAIAFASTGSALAQKKYDSGASDTEIKIGNIMPYSGPASAYREIGKTAPDYFNKVKPRGGTAALGRHRRHQVERAEGVSLDHGLAAQLSERGADLCQISAQGKAGREDRGIL